MVSPRSSLLRILRRTFYPLSMLDEYLFGLFLAPVFFRVIVVILFQGSAFPPRRRGSNLFSTLRIARGALLGSIFILSSSTRTPLLWGSF